MTALPGWQPIETAPADLRVVLLADVRGNVGQGHRSDMSATGWIFQVPTVEAEATHWMPLPEAPQP